MSDEIQFPLDASPPKIHSLERWREAHREDFKRAEATEAEAKRLCLPEPFQVSTSGVIVWSENGWEHKDEKSLLRFKQMVAITAAILGPPDKITSPAHSFQVVPDLLAQWTSLKYELDGPRKGQMLYIFVRVDSPKGCKIDPRKPQIVGQAPELHPECKAVLDALEAQL